MADFRYVALDRSGKQVTGTLQGRDEGDAAVKVRSLGYFPVEVKTTSSNGSGRGVIGISGGLTRPNIDGGSLTAGDTAPIVTGKRVKRVEILLFTRELSDLIDAGLPIDRALSVLIEQTDSEAVEAMVRHLQKDIRAGKPLSDALRAFPREFPVLYANMIHAGEVSGQLAEVMTRLADFMEKEQKRKQQVIAALTYPMVLIIVAISAVTGLLVFVIPRLAEVFKDLASSGNLPVTTQILLATSNGIAKFWWAIGIGIAAVVLLFRAWVSTPLGRRSFDSFRINAPLFGGLARKMIMARFVRTLGTLLGGGVPILDSMEISGNAVGNSVTEQAVEAVRDGVRNGETLSHSMGNTREFLPLVVHMAAVGEETGRLPQMLVRTADTLDFEVDNTMSRLTSLVEPLVVLLMGGFVGFVVLSILLPIFQANTIVK
jgi:type II secretion system protein F